MNSLIIGNLTLSEVAHFTMLGEPAKSFLAEQHLVDRVNAPTDRLENIAIQNANRAAGAVRILD